MGPKLLKFRVYSNVPANWVNRSFVGSLGNIFGGESGRKFKEVEEKIWENSRTYKVSKYEPSGKYYYFENILVRNEGRLVSEVWEDEVSIEIREIK